MTEVVQLLFRIVWQVLRVLFAAVRLIPYLPKFYRWHKGQKALDMELKRERVDRILNPQKYLGAE